MSAVATEAAAGPPTVPGYTPLPISVLSSIGDLGVDLYVTDQEGQRPTLYCAHDYQPSREEWHELQGKRVRRLLVRNREYEQLVKRLRAELDSIVSEPEIPCADRLEVLHLAMAGELSTAFRLLKVDTALEHGAAVGRRIVKALTSSPAVPDELVGILWHDRGTFTHLMNVSVYAVLLAEALGEHDEKTLSAIATGAALHDIGKRQLPLAILDYPGKLTPAQREVIATHPQRGFEELRPLPGLVWGQLMMVYQHHERMDGHGYPTQVTGAQLHPWARVCAVVDVFEALTGVRPYRKPARVPDVLAMLEEKMSGNHLDAEIVRCWKKTILES